MAPNIRIDCISALKDNYIWSIVDELSQSALIVDPGEARPVVNYLQKNRLKLCGLLITHHHWDHTNGIEALKDLYHCPVYGPGAIAGVTDPVAQTFSPLHFPMTFQVLSIPGHTVEHAAYYSSHLLFCGDTLFAAGCGRIFEGNPEQMFNSLQMLANLPIDTKVYCAHEYTLNNLRFAATVEPNNKYIQDKILAITELRDRNLPSLPSTILDEKNTNPFLRCNEQTVITSAEKYAGEKLTSPVEVFAVLRQWKDAF